METNEKNLNLAMNLLQGIFAKSQFTKVPGKDYVIYFPVFDDDSDGKIIAKFPIFEGDGSGSYKLLGWQEYNLDDYKLDSFVPEKSEVVISEANALDYSKHSDNLIAFINIFLKVQEFKKSGQGIKVSADNKNIVEDLIIDFENIFIESLTDEVNKVYNYEIEYEDEAPAAAEPETPVEETVEEDDDLFLPTDEEENPVSEESTDLESDLEDLPDLDDNLDNIDLPEDDDLDLGFETDEPAEEIKETEEASGDLDNDLPDLTDFDDLDDLPDIEETVEEPAAEDDDLDLGFETEEPVEETAQEAEDDFADLPDLEDFDTDVTEEPETAEDDDLDLGFDTEEPVQESEKVEESVEEDDDLDLGFDTDEDDIIEDDDDDDDLPTFDDLEEAAESEEVEPEEEVVEEKVEEDDDLDLPDFDFDTDEPVEEEEVEDDDLPTFDDLEEAAESEEVEPEEEVVEVEETPEDIEEDNTEPDIEVETEEEPTVNSIDILANIDSTSSTAEEKDVSFVQGALDKLIGLNEVKEKIVEIEKFLSFREKAKEKGIDLHNFNMNMIFVGNPGTGKNTTAKILTKLLHQLNAINEPKLIKVRGKAFKVDPENTFKELDQAMGGVLLIDEVSELEELSVIKLNRFMDDNRSNLIVIFNDTKDDIKAFLNEYPEINSKITFNIEFKDYTVEEIAYIIVMKLEKAGFEVGDEVIEKIQNLVKEYSKHNVVNTRTVYKIFQNVVMNHAISNENIK